MAGMTGEDEEDGEDGEAAGNDGCLEFSHILLVFMELPLEEQENTNKHISIIYLYIYTTLKRIPL